LSLAGCHKIILEEGETMNRKLKAAIILHFGTQEDFASAVKEKTSVVSRVVRGRLRLTPEKKSQWAELLECAPRDIFLDDEKESGSTDSQKQLV
jgi:hypothetical protein